MCAAPVANYFSNPDVTYLAKPTGTPTEDNVRTIEDNMVRGRSLEKPHKKKHLWQTKNAIRGLRSTVKRFPRVGGSYFAQVLGSAGTC